MMTSARKVPTGITAFSLVWAGQVLSILGTGMSRFALGVWAWDLTGSATALGLVAAFSFTAIILLSPIAGALADRVNRKWVMLFSDLGAGLATAGVFALFLTGHLQVWHLYVASVVSGAAEAFMLPAYTASVSTLVPKEQYGRANGMTASIYTISETLAPLLAAMLIGYVGVGGVLLIDVLSFSAAILLTGLVAIPRPSAEANRKRASIWQDSAFGFQYIREHRTLLWMLILSAVSNVLVAFFINLIRPMVLAQTGESATILGRVLSAGGVGGLVGGFLMSAWGGPKRRVDGWLGAVLVRTIGIGVAGVGRTPEMWAIGAFLVGFATPISNACHLAIWQVKVSPQVQGRVFGARRVVMQITVPVATLLVGLLADHVFEPGMRPEGALAAAFSGVVGGNGAGSGMALMMLLAGVLGVGLGVAGYISPAIRHVEQTHTERSEAVANV